MEIIVRQEYCPEAVTVRGDHVILHNFRQVDIIKHEEENFVDVIVSDQYASRSSPPGLRLPGLTVFESLYVEDDDEYDEDEEA